MISPQIWVENVQNYVKKVLEKIFSDATKEYRDRMKQICEKAVNAILRMTSDEIESLAMLVEMYTGYDYTKSEFIELLHGIAEWCNEWLKDG